TEIAFVADPIAATQAALAVTEDVPGKADAGSQRTPAWIPQSADCTLRRQLNHPRAQHLKLVRSRSPVNIGIEVGISIVLDTVVCIAQAVIQGQPGPESPTVLSVDCPVVVTITAREGGLSRRQRHGALWRLVECLREEVFVARRLALR